jgi:formate--tetrahydrofolate ligase
MLERLTSRKNVKVTVARHFAQGGPGAAELAHEVVRLCAARPGTPSVRFAYETPSTLWEKMRAVARKIYHAAEVVADKRIHEQIQSLQAAGYGRFPVCVAKTQYSFSTDPTLRGAPTGHIVNVREVRLAAGAEFIVMICGDVMTMPGLPRVPAAVSIDIDESGKVIGLF